MGAYVHKYFYDVALHIKALAHTVKEGADVYYIIGNSTFFGVNVDSELFYRESFQQNGFSDIHTSIIRKRNCNKNLYEYCVTATKGKSDSSNISQIDAKTLFVHTTYDKIVKQPLLVFE
jgi:hypothetical protein